MGLSRAAHNVLQSQHNEGNVRVCRFPEIAVLCFHKQDGVQVQSLPPLPTTLFVRDKQPS